MSAPRWDPEFLLSMRDVGDPMADQVIASVVDQHRIKAVNEMMASLVENADIVPEHMPAAVRDYLQRTAALPNWAEPEMIRRGEMFFQLNWPIIVTLLLCASLPSAYSAWRGAQVLHLTQRLTKQAHRRIFETAQFLLDVMAPGGLEPHGRGIRSAQKVRLLHACIRHYIENEPKWRKHWKAEWGSPINQEDMAGTLMTFSLQILVGMRRFRIPMSTEDEEGYLHAWKVVGHLMGLDPRLLPRNVDDSSDLFSTIINQQRGRSDEGVELTKDLIEFMRQQMPGRLLSGFPATIIRQSVEPGVADMLDVPPANWTLLLFRIEEAFFRAIDRLELRSGDFSRIIEFVSVRMVDGLVGLERGGKRPPFQIPSSLRDSI